MKKNILLVEDNPDDVEMTKIMFEIGELIDQLHVVNDGAKAVDYLQTATASALGLILLDMNLPKLNGLEVLKRIRANPATQQLPVIILTTSIDYPEISGCQSYAVCGYLQKPIEFDKFVELLRKFRIYHEFYG